MTRMMLIVGSVMGGLGVALGAFGAHGLQGKVEPRLLEVWEVGVRYHMIHALALLAVAWMASRPQPGPVGLAGWLFVSGVVIFSGSLYAMTLTGARWLGMITPVGGLALIAGWVVMAYSAWHSG